MRPPIVCRETEQIIADREWRMAWSSWRLGVQRLHLIRRMYPEERGYRWLYR